MMRVKDEHHTMADVSVTILGLGRVGASVCLALKRYNNKSNTANTFVLTAFSTDAQQVKLAKDAELADRFAANALDAVRGADVVVLTLPAGEIDGLLAYTASEFRAGAVLFDLSRYKQAVSHSADKHLKEVHYVGLTPVLNPKYLFDGLNDTTNANEDLFDDSTVFVMPSVLCAPQAVNLATDFAKVLGGTPQFIDIAEHDALMVSTETLPDVLATAYFLMMSRGYGWDDSQRLTSPTFGAFTQMLYHTHPADLRDESLDNREALVRALDGYLVALRELRDLVADNERDATEAAFNMAADGYQAWLNRRYFNRWDNDRTPEQSEAPGIMHTLFGGFVAGKLRGKKDKSN